MTDGELAASQRAIIRELFVGLRRDYSLSVSGPTLRRGPAPGQKEARQVVEIAVSVIRTADSCSAFCRQIQPTGVVQGISGWLGREVSVLA